MIKRVFIIHGWDGYPEEGWFPWIKGVLEKKGFEVHVPAMPDASNPKINAWVSFLSKQVGKPDKNTFFVGHSIGCQTIIRYLEKVNEDVGGVVFVAGWFSLTPEAIPTKVEQAIAKPWLETPIDFGKVKKATKNFVAVFSDNDPFVVLENSKLFKERFSAKIVVEKNKGHFSGSDGVKELPVVLKELLRISS